MKKPKRLRRPKDGKLWNLYENGKFKGIQIGNFFEFTTLNLKTTKALRAWLTKAIAYLEQEKK